MKPVGESLLLLAKNGTLKSRTQPGVVLCLCSCVEERFCGVVAGVDSIFTRSGCYKASCLEYGGRERNSIQGVWSAAERA